MKKTSCLSFLKQSQRFNVDHINAHYPDMIVWSDYASFLGCCLILGTNQDGIRCQRDIVNFAYSFFFVLLYNSRSRGRSVVVVKALTCETKKTQLWSPSWLILDDMCNVLCAMSSNYCQQGNSLSVHRINPLPWHTPDRMPGFVRS